MNFHTLRMSALALGTAGFMAVAGCGDNTTPTPPAPPTPPTPTTTAATVPDVTTMPMTIPAMSAPATLPTTAAAVDVGAATQAAAGAAGDQTAQAKTWLEETVQYIKDNKLDDAQNDLNKLDGVKGSLPSGMQDQINNLKTTLAAKKAAGSIKIPGM